ncbi:MAG TPA: hypothetical protein VJR89_34585 [Polyangiales bacterium]|nr:hypothetical protein [Polyangiales bacterium]
MQRMFVCHAKSDIEATSEIVDALENALEFPNGTLVASSLPGYASDVHGEGELHAMLTGATLMLALFTERSTYDPEFVFELGAAWALGIDVLPLLLGATNPTDVPWPLRDRPSIRAQDEAAWRQLVQQLSHRLQVTLRPVAQPAPEVLPPPAAAPVPLTAAAAPETISAAVPAPEPEPEPERNNPVSIVAPVMVAGHVPAIPPAPAVPPEAIETEPPPPLAADAFEPPSDVRPSLPSYGVALEAGRALSDCMFNRAENIDFRSELDQPFGRFVDAMGGSWNDLSRMQDFDVWLGVTENLLQNLPNDGKRIAAWYEVGYELAILHNLAGQGLFDTDESRADAERQWRKALERFLIRAENARIPYEDLGRVLALLENLVAPRDERDLSNIARSLDELRQQAAGADRQHTAA